MWRLLTRLDAGVVSTVLAGWLRSRTPPAPARPRRYRTVIAVDGKTLKGARLPESRQVHLLSALDTSTADAGVGSVDRLRDCARSGVSGPTRRAEVRRVGNSE
jgi:hypothetical protein